MTGVMASSFWHDGRAKRVAVRAAYLAVVVFFVGCVVRFYDPRYGFAQLIEFGGRLEKTWIAPLQETTYYERSDSYGYDAQFYSQVAMEPSLRDPKLQEALDAPSYRARRILFGWTAYGLGLGRPALILQAYALQNVLAWLILAVVLLHWFPPVDWGNFVRWTGVLLTAGMCNSVRCALIDGPSLLLIALGVLCVEKNRPWLATAIFATVTLGRETSALGAAAVAEPGLGPWRRWLRLAGQAALVGAPLVLWTLYVRRMLGTAVDTGTGNFGLPFADYMVKWREVVPGLALLGGKDPTSRWSVCALVAVGVQCLFLILRPDWRQPWWRIGICYALLMMVLGSAMWAGAPAGAFRLLIPMQLAFNVLVPRGRRWWAILLLGNCSLLVAPALLDPPVNFDFKIEDTSGRSDASLAAKTWNVELTAGWGKTERNRVHCWSWAAGPAQVVIVNPLHAPVVVKFSGRITAHGARRVTLAFGGRELWRSEVKTEAEPVSTGEIRLAPGVNVLDFTTDRPALPAGGNDTRKIAYSISDVVIELERTDAGG